MKKYKYLENLFCPIVSQLGGQQIEIKITFVGAASWLTVPCMFDECLYYLGTLWPLTLDQIEGIPA